MCLADCVNTPDGRQVGNVQEKKLNRSKDELRELWRTAIKQQILLQRMEKENLKLKGEINESRWRKTQLSIHDSSSQSISHPYTIHFDSIKASTCLCVCVCACACVYMCTDIGWGVFYQCQVHHFCSDPVGMYGHKPRDVPHLTCSLYRAFI